MSWNFIKTIRNDTKSVKNQDDKIAEITEFICYYPKHYTKAHVIDLLKDSNT